MSADLTVRYSEVMQAEKDFNNLTRSSTASEYSDSTLSVRDARKRFEQLSSSTTVTSTPTPSYRKSEPVSSTPSKGPTPSRPPPPTRPLKKRATDSSLLLNTIDSSKGQSAGSPSADKVLEGAGDRNSQDACGDSPKPKARGFKPSLKKSHSAMSTADKQVGGGSPASSLSSATKKLFKRKSGKGENAVSTSDSANGRTNSKSPEATPMASSPVQGSPMLSKKKKQHSTASSSSACSTPTGEGASFPLSDKPGKAGLQKSFSDKVLVETEGRSVQASLNEDDRGKVVGGHKPTAPRVIEDGELKLNLSESKWREAVEFLRLCVVARPVKGVAR